jgi:hypothetical protein
MQSRHDLGGLNREFAERTVSMFAGTEVNLGNRLNAVALGDVDQHGDLDTPTFNERDGLDYGSSNGVLTG